MNRSESGAAGEMNGIRGFRFSGSQLQASGFHLDIGIFVLSADRCGLN